MSIAKPALMRNLTFGWPTRAERHAYRPSLLSRLMMLWASTSLLGAVGHLIRRARAAEAASEPIHLFVTLS